MSPTGAVSVADGADQPFTITPYTGFRILDVLVDGVSQGPSTTSYTFSTVTADHTISASFTSTENYVLWATNGPGGAISPYGGVPASYGTSQTFTISADAGYHVVDVVVGGVSQGSLTSYTFSYVMGDSSIRATFASNTHTITATAGAGGSISPSGAVSVNDGASQTFTITPNPGYHITDVLVDGASVGVVSSYTFPTVTGDHTIAANFAPDPCTITASAGAGGSISPSGAVPVAYGASQTFTITPATGYHVANVLVDGSSVGPVTSYTFSNVTTGHTIAASFSDTYTITASAGLGGTISPSGAIAVTQGSSPAFTITPNAGYNIKSVLVDGASVGPVSSYTFPNVTADHTLAATFIAQVIRITANLTRIRVPLGGNSHFWVKLSDNPYTDVRVAVTWQSGNPEISVQGGADLTFTPGNWDVYQPVRLAATKANQDNANPAVFLLSNPAVTPLVVQAETAKGMPQKLGPWLYLLLDQ